jgi:pilin isopeptide linkage protein
LDKYDIEDGHQIEYTISENALDEYYTSINGYEITNTLKKATISLSATKKLSGRDLTNKDVFNFDVKELTTVDGKSLEGTSKASGQNNIDGDISFTSITVNKADTYEYIISEVEPTNNKLSSVTYSKEKYKAIVVVDNYDKTDSNGTYLKVTSITYQVKFNDTWKDIGKGKTPTFTNSYSVTKTIFNDFSGTKTLNGKSLTAGQFTFQVLDGNGKVVTTGTNDEKGNITFGSITYTSAGEHTYTVREVNDKQGGITYDDTTYTVIVSVKDNGDGTLTATSKNATGLNFTNVYSVDPTEIELTATKILSGNSDLTDNQFNFEVLENDKVVASGTNDANGKITFDPITYTSVGNHTYTVREVNDKQEGITYDSTIYTVKVTVVDNLEGSLIASIEEGNNITFKNIYTSQLTIHKTDIDGNPLSGANFTLTSTDGTVINPEMINESQFLFTGLVDGQYSLTETVIPTGYKGISPIVINIENGIISVPLTNDTDIDTLYIANEEDNTATVNGNEVSIKDSTTNTLGNEIQYPETQEDISNVEVLGNTQEETKKLVKGTKISTKTKCYPAHSPHQSTANYLTSFKKLFLF